MGNHCLKVTFWMQCSETCIQCTPNMGEDWYSTNTSVKDFAWGCFLSSLTAKGIKPYPGRYTKCVQCVVSDLPRGIYEIYTMLIATGYQPVLHNIPGE